jgi:hypothetical protein
VSGLISSLAGAPSAASNAGSYYQNAANEISGQYGSPLANRYSAMEMGALRPQMKSIMDQASAQAAATGIAGSGAGRAMLGNAAAQNAATLTGAVSPLYQQGMAESAGVIGEMPGAQNQAYQDAIQQFYQAISMAGQAAGGMPPNAGSSNYGSFTGGPSYSSGGYAGAPSGGNVTNYYGGSEK